MPEKFTFRSRWLASLAFLAWVSLTWWLFTLPGKALPSVGGRFGDFIIRQGGHLGLHAVMLLLAWRAVSLFLAGLGALGIATAFSLGSAVLDELCQRWVPGRGVNLEDIVFNVCGVLAGVALVLAVRRIAPSSARSLAGPVP